MDAAYPPMYPPVYPPPQNQATGFSDPNQYQTQYTAPNAGLYGAQQTNGYPAVGSTTVIDTRQLGARPGEKWFPRNPTECKCTNCQETVMTTTENQMGDRARFMCCILSIWGMCWVVLCCDAYKDTVHTCPRCKTELGRNCDAPNKRNQVVVMHHTAPGQIQITRG